jgi:hypothetical protein
MESTDTRFWKNLHMETALRAVKIFPLAFAARLGAACSGQYKQSRLRREAFRIRGGAKPVLFIEQDKGLLSLGLRVHGIGSPSLESLFVVVAGQTVHEALEHGGGGRIAGGELHQGAAEDDLASRVAFSFDGVFPGGDGGEARLGLFKLLAGAIEGGFSHERLLGREKGGEPALHAWPRGRPQGARRRR